MTPPHVNTTPTRSLESAAGGARQRFHLCNHCCSSSSSCSFRVLPCLVALVFVTLLYLAFADRSLPFARHPPGFRRTSVSEQSPVNVQLLDSDESKCSQIGAPTGSQLWSGKITNFSCTKLFAGDQAELAAVRTFLNDTSRPEPCYRDCYLGCAPCSELLAGFHRMFNFTNNERDFPLAYALRVHTCATQVELLLRSIYAPHNVYCLHVDGRSPPHFVAAMRRLAECLPNVLLAPIDEDFVYASASQMDADLECMSVVSKSAVKWRYFINLAGQELPLKTNYELVRMLRSLNGSSHMYLERPANADRQAHSWWCKDAQTNRTVRCPEPLRSKPPPPNNVTIYKSYANTEFSRAFVDYLLDPGSFARRLYDWLSDTYAPEEHYYVTLLALPEAPGGMWSGAFNRAILWYGDGECAGQFVRAICVFASGDLQRLVVDRPEAFVNKLHYQEDPVAVRCLVESVMEREARQHSPDSAVS